MPFIIDGGGGTPSPTPTPVPAPIATSQVDVYVDNTSTGVTTSTGNIAAPFLTIQEALNKIGKPTSSADSLRLMCVHVSSGNYTETLNVPEGRMIKIVCHGWVNFTGNINYLSDGNARLGSGIRSFLSISGIDNNLATSTHIGRQGGMTINGRIIRKCTSVTGITTHDLYLSNVVVTGGIGYDSSIAQAGGTSLYLVRSRLQGTTSDQVADSGTGFPLAIQQIEDSKIEGTLKVSRLGGATRTEFASCAMTVLQAGGDIPPFGYYDCLFTGSTSLTAPAGAFKLNGVSYKNAASVPLSGGVAREYIDGESPLLATLTSNTFSGTQTAPNFTGNALSLNTVTPAAGGVGQFVWNDGDGTAEITLKGGNTVLQLGQEQVVRVYNASGSALTDGQVVSITGAQGNRLSVVLADVNDANLSRKTIGVVTEPIAAGAEGFVCTFGIVRNLNTSSFTEGSEVYLGSVAGTLTETRPTSPSRIVLVGNVVRSSATVGSIFVKVSQESVPIAESALKLQTARTISLTGDVSGSASFDGSQNISIVTTSTPLGYTAENVANKGQPNGYAALDANSKVVQTALLSDAASKLQTARNITLTGDITGSASFDGSQNISITTTSNITGFATLGANNFTGKQQSPEFESALIDGDSYIEGYRNNTTASGAININLALGGVFEYTLAGDVTFSVSGAPTLSNEVMSFVVKVNQGPTPRVVTWFNNLLWLSADGAPSSPSANKSAEYIFTTTDGVNFIGRKGAFN